MHSATAITNQVTSSVRKKSIPSFFFVASHCCWFFLSLHIRLSIDVTFAFYYHFRFFLTVISFMMSFNELITFLLRIFFTNFFQKFLSQISSFALLELFGLFWPQLKNSTLQKKIQMKIWWKKIVDSEFEFVKPSDELRLKLSRLPINYIVHLRSITNRRIALR